MVLDDEIMSGEYKDSFAARLALVTENRVGMQLDDNQKVSILQGLFSSPVATHAVKATGKSETGSVTTMETSQSKNERERVNLVVKWLGDMENPRLTKMSAAFYEAPENFASWAKQRLETIFREMGMLEGQEGHSVKTLLDEAVKTPDQPIPDVQGTGIGPRMAKGIVRKALLRLLALYVTIQADRKLSERGDKPLSIQKRRDEEEKLMNKLLNPTVIDRAADEAFRICYDGIALSDKHVDQMVKTMGEAEKKETGTKVDKSGTKEEKHNSADKWSTGKRSRPPGWEAMDHKGKLACVKKEGWCIKCLDDANPKYFKGLSEEHHNHPK